MKRLFLCSCLFMLATCLFTACGSDDEDVVNSGTNDSSVVINDDGTTSNGSRYTPIDDKNFYLDYIKYSIEEAHLIVSGYDKAGFSGTAKIVSAIKFKGVRYEVFGIGKQAFEKCKSLTSITIPSGVVNIDSAAFVGCTNMTSVHITDLKAWCKIRFVSITSNPLHYSYYLFINGEQAKDLAIPDGTTSIGDYAFTGIKINSITIPNSVTNIGIQTFYKCSGLTSITIPNSVASIGTNAFYNCLDLTSVHITDLNAWCNIKFANENCNPLCCANRLFINGEEIKDLVIPNTVTKINSHAFYGFKNLTSVIISNSVTSIGQSTFGGCAGLTSVFIPNSVINIGSSAFAGCSSLTSILLPNSVTSIGNYTFARCSNLSSVTIGNAINNIGDYAFSDCTTLTDVYCYVEKVPNTGSNTFKNSNVKNATLHVPNTSVSRYQYAERWKQFETIVALTDNDPRPIAGN